MLGLTSFTLLLFCSLSFYFSLLFSLPSGRLLEHFLEFWWLIYSVFDCISLASYFSDCCLHYSVCVYVYIYQFSSVAQSCPTDTHTHTHTHIYITYHSLLMSDHQYEWQTETLPHLISLCPHVYNCLKCFSIYL